jgi:hypothetical protein
LEICVQKLKAILRSDGFISSALILVAAALVYLPFVFHIGYFNDDWYLMYAAGAKGTMVFREIFSIDRPLRALVMIPAYLIFGNNPVLYNLSAWLFRVISAIFLFFFFSTLWEGQKRTAWLLALLHLIYPGFLSQLNGIDYQSQMVSLAAMTATLVLTLSAWQTPHRAARLGYFAALTALTTFYLGLVEYFVGLEALKLALVILLVFRAENGWRERLTRSALWLAYSLSTALPFLVWRLFFFESERGATDVNMQLGGVLSNPPAILFHWVSTLWQDVLDVLFFAWREPMQRMTFGMTSAQWQSGFLLAALVLALVWAGSKRLPPASGKWNWRLEALWLGSVMLLAGLLPVIIVGREVDFESFSRYALAPAIGAVLLWQAALGFIPSRELGAFVSTLLILSSTLTHFGGGLSRARDTESIRNFWWQVSWRIPQMENGTTLVANYPALVEEDYFIWGPANLIYQPESANEKYVQPAIYAALLNEETIASVQSKQPQDFSNRRGIRTYKNYRNILVLSQPTLSSCVQVIDGQQVELSASEDERVKAIAAFSEVEHILTSESFHTPPAIPFGAEPTHSWCYFYQKAALARQMGDWREAARLGDEALALGFSAGDEIEWMPFLQAYAMLDNSARVGELAPLLTSDLVATHQACQSLTALPLSTAMMDQVNKLFCDK